MTAEEQAGQAALAELLALGMPTRPAQALAGAMQHGVRAAIDLVADEYRDRAANPRAWHAFHRAMADRLPRWRWIARGHHRRMARRYLAMMLAGTSVPCEVPR